MTIRYQTYLTTRAFKGDPSHFELTFPVGAVVLVPDGLDGAKVWWGQYLNHSGLFPASHVRSIEEPKDNSKTTVLPMRASLVKTCTRDDERYDKIRKSKSCLKSLGTEDNHVCNEKFIARPISRSKFPNSIKFQPPLNPDMHLENPDDSVILLFGGKYREDVCFAFLGKRRPKLPLREELRSLGFEVVLRPIHTENKRMNIKKAIGYDKYNKKLKKASKGPGRIENLILRVLSRWMYGNAVESRDPINDHKNHLPDMRSSSDGNILPQKAVSKWEKDIDGSIVSFQLSELFCGNYSKRKISSVLVNNVISVQFCDTDSDISSTTEHYAGYDSKNRNLSSRFNKMNIYPQADANPPYFVTLIDKDSFKSCVKDTITFIFPSELSEDSPITKPNIHRQMI